MASFGKVRPSSYAADSRLTRSAGRRFSACQRSNWIWPVLPRLDEQSFDLSEMFVPADEHEAVLDRSRGNPEIVLRDRSTFPAQTVAQSRVVASGRRIARNHRTAGDEPIDRGEVLLDTLGLLGAETELAGDDGGEVELRAWHPVQR